MSRPPLTSGSRPLANLGEHIQRLQNTAERVAQSVRELSLMGWQMDGHDAMPEQVAECVVQVHQQLVAIERRILDRRETVLAESVRGAPRLWGNV